MDYEEIQNRLKEIIKMTPKAIPDSEMAKIHKIIDKNCSKSKPFFDEMIKCMPGGTQHQMVIKQPFPVTMKKCLGARMWDVDDNEYVDYLMSAGACILGHCYPPLKEEIIKIYHDQDPNLYWNSEWEIKAIKEIKKHVPSIERLQYFQSGTEADMAAIRIARVFTGKEKIIKFGGSYHGWSDQLTYDIHIPFSGNMESDGIPRGCYKDTVSIPPGDLKALEDNLKKWSEKRSGVAAIIVEPLGPESGAIPNPPRFNQTIRDLCDEYGVLLIFDEVVTGFRLDLGGAQKVFGIIPDLTVFGKILTHGFPSAGAVGGREDVMNVITGDVEAGGKHAFVGGTIRGNPLSVASTYWTIKLIEKSNAINNAAKSADDLVKKLNDLFERDGRPYFAHNYKSILHFETYSPLSMDIRVPENIEKAVFRKKCVDEIAVVMLSQGVITKYGNRGFCCLSHSAEDNNKFMEAFENVLKLIPK